MNDRDLIREILTRLTPGQAASLRDQARAELARRQAPPPAPPPTAADPTDFSGSKPARIDIT